MAKTATPRQVTKLLEKHGFVLSRQRGSHAIYIKEHRMIVVPMHARDLKKGTLNRILKRAGLTVDDL